MVVAELFRVFKMTLPAIFSILNNVRIRRNICLNFRKFKRENKPLFWQKWTPDVFFLFPAAIFVSLGRTQKWRLNTNLYKFVGNIMSNNSSTVDRTDLRLGQSPYLFMVYNVSIFWLHSVNGFRFLFWWRDSENRQYIHTHIHFIYTRYRTCYSSSVLYMYTWTANFRVEKLRKNREIKLKDAKLQQYEYMSENVEFIIEIKTNK